jgi:hypothetical protein
MTYLDPSLVTACHQSQQQKPSQCEFFGKEDCQDSQGSKQDLTQRLHVSFQSSLPKTHGKHRKKCFERRIRAGGVAQVVQHLPSKLEVQSSNSETAKNQRIKKKKEISTELRNK